MSESIEGKPTEGIGPGKRRLFKQLTPSDPDKKRRKQIKQSRTEKVEVLLGERISERGQGGRTRAVQGVSVMFSTKDPKKVSTRNRWAGVHGTEARYKGVGDGQPTAEGNGFTYDVSAG